MFWAPTAAAAPPAARVLEGKLTFVEDASAPATAAAATRAAAVPRFILVAGTAVPRARSGVRLVGPRGAPCRQPMAPPIGPDAVGRNSEAKITLILGDSDPLTFRARMGQCSQRAMYGSGDSAAGRRLSWAHVISLGVYCQSSARLNHQSVCPSVLAAGGLLTVESPATRPPLRHRLLPPRNPAPAALLHQLQWRPMRQRCWWPPLRTASPAHARRLWRRRRRRSLLLRLQHRPQQTATPSPLAPPPLPPPPSLVACSTASSAQQQQAAAVAECGPTLPQRGRSAQRMRPARAAEREGGWGREAHATSTHQST